MDIFKGNLVLAAQVGHLYFALYLVTLFMKLIELIKNLHEILKWDHTGFDSVMLPCIGEEQTVPEMELAPMGKTLSELRSLGSE